MRAAIEREAERQQLLLRTLWRDEPPSALQTWLGPRDNANALGLRAYRTNAGAIAERALAGAFPTVAALVGDESFGALARDFWRQHPPLRGDLGEWGGALACFIAASTALASEPYLDDSARLDWLVHLAARAADVSDALPELDALNQFAPEQLRLELRPGCALLASNWPVAGIWHAHQDQGDDRFDAVREALAAARGENAFVSRDGFAVRVETLDAHAAAFAQALLAGHSLAAALDAASDKFAFDHWLVQALRQRWLVAVQSLPSKEAS